jgi:hypothetical protein
VDDVSEKPVRGWGEFRLTNVFVLDVAPGLGVDLGLCVGLIGEVLNEHFLVKLVSKKGDGHRKG